jgi:smad nuclear-interacting protein 1
VEHVSDVVKVGDQVWVRMLEEERPGRHSASMKVVDQSTGAYVGGVGGGDAAAGRRPRRSTEPEEDVSQMTWGLQPLDRGQEDDGAAEAAEAKPKVQPNFGTTGKLAEASNMVNGVSLKWVEPSDAMKPTKRWRLYVFKGKEALEPYHIHRQSAYLLGRERRVADIPLDHPSCSSQHAVLQFRLTSKTSAGKTTKLVRPYVMDLGSTNGTYVNGERIEAERYVELLERDLLRFGYSSREYVLLHEESGGGS